MRLVLVCLVGFRSIKKKWTEKPGFWSNLPFTASQDGFAVLVTSFNANDATRSNWNSWSKSSWCKNIYLSVKFTLQFNKLLFNNWTIAASISLMSRTRGRCVRTPWSSCPLSRRGGRWRMTGARRERSRTGPCWTAATRRARPRTGGRTGRARRPPATGCPLWQIHNS